MSLRCLGYRNVYMFEVKCNASLKEVLYWRDIYWEA